jgi:hypothetical protein
MSSRRAIGVFGFLPLPLVLFCFVAFAMCFHTLFALRSCLLCYFSHSSGVIWRFVSCADRVVSPTLSRTPWCCCNYFVASPFSAIQFSVYGIYVVVGSSLSSVFSSRCSLHGRDVCIPRGTHVACVVPRSFRCLGLLGPYYVRQAVHLRLSSLSSLCCRGSAGFSRLVLPLISC